MWCVGGGVPYRPFSASLLVIPSAHAQSLTPARTPAYHLAADGDLGSRWQHGGGSGGAAATVRVKVLAEIPWCANWAEVPSGRGNNSAVEE